MCSRNFQCMNQLYTNYYQMLSIQNKPRNVSIFRSVHGFLIPIPIILLHGNRIIKKNSIQWSWFQIQIHIFCFLLHSYSHNTINTCIISNNPRIQQLYGTLFSTPKQHACIILVHPKYTLNMNFNSSNRICAWVIWIANHIDNCIDSKKIFPRQKPFK